jgi:far upstream element-binding protein
VCTEGVVQTDRLPPRRGPSLGLGPGLVIGRNGETIRQLQIKAGADIQVSRDDGAGAPSRSVTIMGPPEEVGIAEMLIQKIVKEKEMAIAAGGSVGTDTGAGGAPMGPGGAGSMYGGGGGGAGGGYGGGGGGGGAQEMFVPQNHVGLVIGRGGETIRRLQDTSGANIQVAKDAAGNEPPGMRKIELMGGLGQVAEAKRMIGELIAQVGPVSPSVLSSRHVPRCANLLMGGWLSCRAFHRRTPVEVVAAA